MPHKHHVIVAHDICYTIRTNEGSLINQRIEETGGPYEDWLLEHIYQQQFKGRAVDVGAHIGNHTLWFACVCKLAVSAFEPIFGDELKDNLSLNSGNPHVYSVDVHRVALGRERNTAASDRGMRVLSGPGVDRGPGTAEGRLAVGDGPIPVTTLDAFELDDVAFIKIDVEGMEPDVLRGAEETIKSCRPVIFAESPDEDAHLRLKEVLMPHGYYKAARFKRGTPIERWDPK